MFLYNNCKLCNSTLKPLIERKKISVCSNCGLIFFTESLDKEQVEKLYQELYSNDVSYARHITQGKQINSGIQPRISSARNNVLQKVLKHKPVAVAEIGAGVGVIGKYLTDRKYNYSGFELEKAAADAAQKSGINIKNTGFEALAEYTDNFDALVTFEVIEHIDDLKLCLQLVNNSLKQGGTLGFTVPNFNKKNNHKGDFDKLYQPNPPVHINFFTVENINKILPMFGFTVEYLQAQRLPPMYLTRPSTYINLGKSVLGKFEGSSVMCVAKKVKNVG